MITGTLQKQRQQQAKTNKQTKQKIFQEFLSIFFLTAKVL